LCELGWIQRDLLRTLPLEGPQPPPASAAGHHHMRAVDGEAAPCMNNQGIRINRRPIGGYARS
jgi:hypothetical protein